MRTSTILSTIAATLAAASASNAAFAQGEPEPALEEIIVTAQKRSESLQDTPVAVTAVTGESLESLNRDDIAAIAVQTPSLAYSEAGGEAQIYIRGVGSNLFTVGADPSVAMHLDGVYVARANMGINQFFDVERVEVLRGPQGTLYGRNATGGAINILSRMPTDEFEGYGSVLFGSFDRRELKGAISGPLSAGWSGRLAVRALEDEGYTDDLDPRGGDEIDDNDLRAVRGTARWSGESVELTVIGDYSEFDGGNTSIRPIDALGAARVLGAVPTRFGDTRNNVPSFFEWQTGGVNVTLEWRISDALTLTSVSGYRAWDSDFLFNTDGTEIEVTRTTQVYDTKQYSEELRLNGDFGRLKWIAGAYYLDEDRFGALGLVRANLATPGVFIIPADNDGTALAFFGQADYAVTDRLTFTAGIRYSDEKKEDVSRQLNVFAPPLGTTPLSEILVGLFGNLNFPPMAAGSRTGDKTWQAWTPKIGLSFAPNEDVLLYASYSKGFKSGGYNDFQPSNPVYDPEFIKSYEVGAKTEWLDNRLRLNAAVFYYDYTDLQVSSFLNSLTITTNAADSTVKGAELELQWRPIDSLDLNASLGYLDAKYDRYLATYGVCTLYAIQVVQDRNCLGTNPFTGAPFVPGNARPVNASGNRLNNAPEIKSTLSALYSFELGGAGSLSLFGQLAYQDEIFFNPANDPNARQDAVTLLDARVAYTTASGALEIAAFGKNLSDEEYFHNIVQFTSTSLPPPAAALPPPTATITDPLSIGHALGYPAPGRQWGVELTYRFGR
jgi:iron complex outermembrane receptor protein